MIDYSNRSNARGILQSAIDTELQTATRLKENVEHSLDRLADLRTEIRLCEANAKKLQAALDALPPEPPSV
jgi:hypothetical protein